MKRELTKSGLDSFIGCTPITVRDLRHGVATIRIRLTGIKNDSFWVWANGEYQRALSREAFVDEGAG